MIKRFISVFAMLLVLVPYFAINASADVIYDPVGDFFLLAFDDFLVITVIALIALPIIIATVLIKTIKKRKKLDIKQPLLKEKDDD